MKNSYTGPRRLWLGRRRFLQSLNLGAGAAFLSPIVEGLVSRAQGAHRQIF